MTLTCTSPGGPCHHQQGLCVGHQEIDYAEEEEGWGVGGQGEVEVGAG